MFIFENETLRVTRLFLIAGALAISAQAATITVKTDPLAIGTYLTGSFSGSISTDTQQLTGSWQSLGGTLGAEFAGAVVSSNLSGFDGFSTFSFDSVKLVATDGAVIEIGPGSSHMTMGAICGAGCYNFWQDSSRLPNGAFAATSGDWRAIYAIPEPGNLALGGIGLLALNWWGRRRK